MGNSTPLPGREIHHHTQKEVIQIQRMELLVFVFSYLFSPSPSLSLFLALSLCFVTAGTLRFGDQS